MNQNILHIGLCLPESCTNEQVSILLQRLFDCKQHRHEFAEKSKVLRVKDLSLDPTFFLRKSVLILFFAIVISFWLSRSAKNLNRRKMLDKNNNPSLATESETKLSMWEGIVAKCFDYEKNKMEIRSKEPSPLTVGSITGLR